MKSAETSDVPFRGLCMHGKECYKFISIYVACSYTACMFQTAMQVETNCGLGFISVTILSL